MVVGNQRQRSISRLKVSPLVATAKTMDFVKAILFASKFSFHANKTVIILAIDEAPRARSPPPALLILLLPRPVYLILEELARGGVAIHSRRLRHRLRRRASPLSLAQYSS